MIHSTNHNSHQYQSHFCLWAIYIFAFSDMYVHTCISDNLVNRFGWTYTQSALIPFECCLFQRRVRCSCRVDLSSTKKPHDNTEVKHTFSLDKFKISRICDQGVEEYRPQNIHARQNSRKTLNAEWSDFLVRKLTRKYYSWVIVCSWYFLLRAIEFTKTKCKFL